MQENALTTQGFVLARDVVPRAECDAIGSKIVPDSQTSAGSRAVLSFDWCQGLAARLRTHPALASCLPSDYVAFQCTYFSKSSSCNWLVPIHQDLSIPVAERVDDPELRGWSEKEGSLFVQPPAELLERLVIVRLHLDPCGPEDGPLHVLPGTHRQGRFEPEAVAAARRAQQAVVCSLECGDVLVMRPLLLHASSKASGSSRRRVLHFVFGPRELPYGLRWQQVV